MKNYNQISLFSDDDTPLEDDFQIVFNDSNNVLPGDVYELGVHRLMCGDATKQADVLRLTNGAIMDLYLTDPPYNVDYEGNTEDSMKIMNDKMKALDFREFLKKAFKNADEVMRPGAVFYIWFANSETYNFMSACQDIGWRIRQQLIWVKNQFVMGRQDYHWQHEPCLYGWKEGAHTWTSDRKQTTILLFDKPQRNNIHPTMKPIELFMYQMKNNTTEGQNVLDTFSGSGTTLISAELSNRISYNMELDPNYCAVIIRRWERLTGKKAVKID